MFCSVHSTQATGQACGRAMLRFLLSLVVRYPRREVARQARYSRVHSRGCRGALQTQESKPGHEEVTPHAGPRTSFCGPRCSLAVNRSTAAELAGAGCVADARAL